MHEVIIQIIIDEKGKPHLSYSEHKDGEVHGRGFMNKAVDRISLDISCLNSEGTKP